VNSEYVLVIGAVASLLMTELVGLSPGGIIVPGYLALYWNEPWRLGATLADAALSFGAVRLFARHLILFGRRRYAAFLLAGFLARFSLERILPTVAPEAPILVAVGWLIPGIMAADADRQGPGRTLAAAAAATLLVKIVWMALA
jgi:gamma-polyglutamate biosynthesis protein CapC